MSKNGSVTSSAYGPLEDESCRDVVLPGLRGAGWDDRQIRVAFPLNRGRVRAVGLSYRQDQPLIADYVLEYSKGLPVAVIEARRSRRDPLDGCEQVRRYAELLDAPFAYTTNGRRILEVDGRTGRVSEVPEFPSPEELWRRYRRERDLGDDGRERLALAPLDQERQNQDGTALRYYQQVAINRVVQAIARGERRALLLMATRTGKAMVAAQVVAKLRNAGWPGGREPRILHLTDHEGLIGRVQRLGFEEAEGRYQEFDPDAFDLVIVDECHRVRAPDNALWHTIAERFSSAVQLGFTIAPAEFGDSADVRGHFGSPLYSYSLARGIEDGFLAPFRVRQVRLNIDPDESRSGLTLPDPGDHVRAERRYGPRAYQRTLAVLDRTEEAARYLRDYMTRTGRLNKMLVFCQDDDHADRVARALRDVNPDLVASHGDSYVCRVTERGDDAGRRHLDEFRQVDSVVPAIAVTSGLLPAGTELPALRSIVLLRVIDSMPEFKQILGCGTRLFPEEKKFSFDIVDFAEATRLFNDLRFDGSPFMLLRDETDGSGHISNTIGSIPMKVSEKPFPYSEASGGQLPAAEEADSGPKRYRVDAPAVMKVEVDYAHGQIEDRPKRQEFRQFVRDRVTGLRLEPYELLAQWAGTQTRKSLRKRLDKWHITAENLAEWTGHPDSDTIDLLLFITWQLPLLTRAERAHRAARRNKEFLASFPPRAREVLARILDRYVAWGPDELDVAALQSDAYSDLGTSAELAGRFGDAARIPAAIDELGKLLYSPA